MLPEGTVTKRLPLPHGQACLEIYCPSLASITKPGDMLECQDHVLGIYQFTQTHLQVISPHSMDVGTICSLGRLVDPTVLIPLSCDQPLLIAQEHTIASVLCFLRANQQLFRGIVLLEAKQFPFLPTPSKFLTPSLPPELIAAAPLLEDWQIPSRLASAIPQPGIFHGPVHELQAFFFHQHS